MYTSSTSGTGGWQFPVRYILSEKQMSQIEMNAFDSLAPCIRKVIRNHPVGVEIWKVLRDPQAKHMADNHPELFAQRMQEALDYALRKMEAERSNV